MRLDQVLMSSGGLALSILREASIILAISVVALIAWLGIVCAVLALSAWLTPPHGG